jgi:translation initiation factor IF-1
MHNNSQKEPSAKEAETITAVVTEALPNTLFKVKADGQEVETLAYLSGKMRLHRIRVLVGDKVEILIDPYGGKGRIIRRY